MDASLTVPTATSVRTIPAKLMIDNRIVINNHLTRARGGKVSFTHLIGWALIQALKEFPSQNVYYDEIDGKPSRRRPGAHQPRHRHRHAEAGRHPRPAGAGHQARRHHGLRRVPRRLRGPGRQGPRQQAHRRRLPGTTDLAHQPGRHRHRALRAAPHAGPGLHHRRRRARVPGRVPGRVRRRRSTSWPSARPSRSPSTYDHRVIQGAGSGEFLKKVHELLIGQHGFYEDIFAALRIPYDPIHWAHRHQRRPRRATSDKTARVQELINSFRVRGHLMADIDPLEYVQRTHPDLEIDKHGLTFWDLDREFVTGGFGGKRRCKLRDILGVLRDSYCRTIGIEYMHIQDPEQRRWFQENVERPYSKPGHDEQLRILGKLNEAEAFETFLQTKYVGQKRFSLEGGESTIPLLDEILQGAAEARPRRGRHRHGPPRPPQRADQHRRQDLRPGLPRVRGHPGPAHRAGLRRRQVPPRHRGHLHRRPRRGDPGVPRRQPVAPRGRRRRARGHRPRQAGPQADRQLPRAADPGARRRGLGRPGRRGRDPADVAAARLPHRRHHPRRRQQPGRLHHLAGRGPHLGLLDRCRQDHPGADLPRERRRPRGRRAGRRARVRVPPAVPQRRRHRPRLLPPPRPQRGRRPLDDAAAHVQPHRGQALGAHAVHRGARRPRRHHRGGVRAGASSDFQDRLELAFAETHAAQTGIHPGHRRRNVAVNDLERPQSQRDDGAASRRAPASTRASSSSSATRSTTRPRASPCTRSCSSCSRSAST